MKSSFGSFFKCKMENKGRFAPIIIDRQKRILAFPEREGGTRSVTEGAKPPSLREVDFLSKTKKTEGVNRRDAHWASVSVFMQTVPPQEKYGKSEKFLYFSQFNVRMTIHSKRKEFLL